jgi:hypothetical protein
LNQTLIRAVIVVTFALAAYSTAVITEQRKKVLSNFVLVFLTIGVILDISSTALMIIGSGKIPITAHGFLGYSALAVMLIDAILIWRCRIRNDREVSRSLNLYTRFAYGWWVVAYIAGAIIAIVLER